jgi:hypothetical protein
MRVEKRQRCHHIFQVLVAFLLNCVITHLVLSPRREVLAVVHSVVAAETLEPDKFI